MGYFSWCYCDAGEIKKKDGMYAPSKAQRLIVGNAASVLVPKEFGGKEAQIDEYCYDGYGHFGPEDIFDLVADWNRRWAAEHPEWIPPHAAAYAKKYPEYGKAVPIGRQVWYPFYADLSLSREEVVRHWDRDAHTGLFHPEYRTIGIAIACYDEDNAAIPYPVKIAADPASVYEDCGPSPSDLWQGCF